MWKNLNNRIHVHFGLKLPKKVSSYTSLIPHFEIPALMYKILAWSDTTKYSQNISSQLTLHEGDAALDLYGRQRIKEASCPLTIRGEGCCAISCHSHTSWSQAAFCLPNSLCETTVRCMIPVVKPVSACSLFKGFVSTQAHWRNSTSSIISNGISALSLNH